MNESFDKAFHPTDKQRLLDASHVFSLTTASIGAAKPTGRTSVNTSVYVHADPGGKGIDRLRDLYRAFVEEQEAMATREGGPGQNVNMADLLLNQVFSNPLHRGTEIVTDPAFLAYVEQNQKLTKKLRRLQGTKEVRSGEAGMALEPRFKVEEELFDGKHPVEGYQIGISEEQYDSEKQRYLQHT